MRKRKNWSTFLGVVLLNVLMCYCAQAQLVPVDSTKKQLDRLVASKDATDQQMLNDRLKLLAASNKESEMTMAAQYYYRLKNVRASDSLYAAEVVKFPKGMQARSKEAAAIYDIKDLAKAEKAYNEWIKKFPPEYFPAYCKWLFYGGDSTAVIEPHIRIFDKIGDSYGYDIDNAYIVEFKNKVEFILTAVVQSNDDGIYNDDKYEYKTVCLPFMKNLGRVIYQYELNRPKKYLPDLKKFKFNY